MNCDSPSRHCGMQVSCLSYLVFGKDVFMSVKNQSPSSRRPAFSSIAKAAKSARYLGVIAILLGIGAFGHLTHWTFQKNGHDSSPTAQATTVMKPAATESVPNSMGEVDDSAPGKWKVIFPTENSFALSGITTTNVEQRAIAERVSAAGVITYDERHLASLSSRTTGTVWRVCKHVGETIRQGDVLVVIDAAEVGQSKAEFLSALIAVEAKADILSNLESVASGAIPMRQVRSARVALREAKIHLLNAEQTLVNLGFSVKADDYQKLSDAERAYQLRFLGLPETLLKDLDREKTTSNLLPMRAAFDGVVLKQDVALGETAEAGKPILDIADTRRMWLKLNIPKEDASKLVLGQQVTFNPDGIEKELHASITWISTEMNEQTRTLQIRAEVDNPAISSDNESNSEVRLLRANTFGSGTVVLRNHESALVVPESSVLHEGEQALVFTRTSDRTFERVDVELGVRDGGFVEIRSSAIHSGTEVVSRGAHILKSECSLKQVIAAIP